MSREMDWMEPYLRAYFGRLITSIKKLCYKAGIGHLADEVAGEVLVILCENHRDYNPDRGSFMTWALMHAKGVVYRMTCTSTHQRYGGTKTCDVSMEYEYMFAESEPLAVSDEGDLLCAVHIDFDDPFERPDMSGTKAKLFLGKLTDGEKSCLELLLADGRVRYRQLGKKLGVSHTQAGKLLPGLLEGLQDKARQCLQR